MGPAPALTSSQDETGFSKIWNVRSEHLISFLKKNSEATSYSKIFADDQDEFVFGISETRIDVWQLAQKNSIKHFKESDTDPDIILTSDGEKCVINFDNKTLYVININNFLIENKIEMPDDVVDFEFMENGDVHLLIENKDFDREEYFKSLQKSKSKRFDSQANKKRKSIYLSSNTTEELADMYGSSITQNGVHQNGFYPLPSGANNSFKARESQTFKKSEKEVFRSNETNLENGEKKFKFRRSLFRYAFDKNQKEYKITSFKNKKTNIEDNVISEIPINLKLSLHTKTMEILHKKEIDPIKYKFYIKKLVIREYNKDRPEDCLYEIYKGIDNVLGMHTSSTSIEKRINLKGNRRSSPDSIDSISNSSGDSESEDDINSNSIYIFETTIFLNNKKIEKIRYLTDESMVPTKDQIAIENIFEFDYTSQDSVNQRNIEFSYKDSISSWRTLQKDNVDSSQSVQTASDFMFCGIYNNALVKWTFFSYFESIDGDVWFNLIARNNNKKAKNKGKDIYKIGIKMKKKSNLRMDQNFQMKLAKPSQSKSGKFVFYLDSASTLITFRFSLKTKKLCYFKVLSKESSSHNPVCYSKKKRLFLIPIKNKIHVYDNRLKFHLDKLEMNKNVEQIIVNDDRDLLMIYDLYFYYEVDMNRLIMRRQMAATNRTKDQFFYPMNMRDLPTGTPWKGVFYYLGSKTIRPIATSEGLELKSFPFRVLNRCFDRKVHAPAVKQYASYYYSKLDESGRIDHEYGPLNPLFMAIFNQNTSLLEELLNKHYYPSRVFHYVSPLEYAFICKNKTGIKKICEGLLRRDEMVYFSRIDFKYLLSSNQKICHKVISTMISDPQINGIPHMVYMNGPVMTKSCEDKLSITFKLKKENHHKAKKIEKKIKHNKKNIRKGAKKFFFGNQTQTYQSEISVGMVPFKYNYKTGTEDSVMLIDRFSQSTSDEFILSDWKEIINFKWKTIKRFYIGQMFIFYSFLVFITLSLSLMIENQLCRWISVALDIFFLIFEIFRFITFAVYKPSL